MKHNQFVVATVLLLTAIVGSLSLHAQNGTLSPYSRFGYGLLRDNATSAQRAMGGIGYAMNSGRQINVMNPASYARVDSLTFLFDMGVDLTNVWMEEGSGANRVRESHIGGGLDYITMQFPLGRYMGASVGLLPYSSVGYAFGNDIHNGAESREGGGSFNMLYLGVAGRLWRGLSIGANISYMFGTLYNDDYAYTSTGGTSLFERQLEVRDYHLQFGIQYSHRLTPISVLTAGLTYSPAKKLLGHHRTYLYDPTPENAEPIEVDHGRLGDKYSLAESWGAGLNFQWRAQLMVEADFTYQPWSKARFPGVNESGVAGDHGLSDRYKIAVGGHFIPAPRGSYFKRVAYRAGAFWNRDYLRVQGNNVREYGVSVGAGLPVPGFKTIINVGFEWTHRQAYPASLVKENYLYVTLGINFNESWFRQSKIY